MDSLTSGLIWIVAAALIYLVVMWGIERIGIPEPFHKIIIAVVVIVVVFLLVNALMTLAGSPIITR